MITLQQLILDIENFIDTLIGLCVSR